MSTFRKLKWSLLMLCLAPVLCGCSQAASPVLETELFGLPRDTARLDLIITWNGSTGSAAFYRDGMNNYTTAIMMPAAQDSPPQTALAVDLPAGTVGKVVVRAESRPALMMGPSDLGDPGDLGVPPAQPGAAAAGCATVNVTAGTLTKVQVSLMAPPPPPC
jgi:hypothetical protein